MFNARQIIDLYSAFNAFGKVTASGVDFYAYKMYSIYYFAKALIRF